MSYRYTLKEQDCMLWNDLGMSFTRQYAGRVNKDGWLADRFLFIFTNKHTKKTLELDYFVGIGWAEQHKKPTPFDVLYSIVMDNPHGMLFEEWCEEYGYNNDSIKALKIYEACCKQTAEFKNIFPEIHLENYQPIIDYNE